MPDEQHVMLLCRSVREWNRWRAENPQVTPDLAGAGLRGLDLSGANLSGAELKEADLRGTILSGSSLAGAGLAGANLFKAVLDSVELDGTDLRRMRFLDCAQLTTARKGLSGFGSGMRSPHPSAPCMNRDGDAQSPNGYAHQQQDAGGGHSALLRRLGVEG